MKKES
jgi:hypothetical protein